MSNHGEDCHLIVVVTKKDEINEKTLIPIFNVDGDFFENEEYFRPSTIRLGYENESERCAKEIYRKCRKIKEPLARLQAMMDMVPAYSPADQPFLIGNNTYCGDYQIELTEVGEAIVISVAYVC